MGGLSLGSLNPVAAIGTAANVAGSYMNYRAAEKDRAMQYDFAKQGIQWRANDARAAGIHPLAAMGASLNSASPVSVGSDPGQPFRQLARHMYDAQLQEMVANGRLTNNKADYWQNMADITEHEASALETAEKMKKRAAKVYGLPGQAVPRNMMTPWRDNTGLFGKKGEVYYFMDQELNEATEGTRGWVAPLYGQPK